MSTDAIRQVLHDAPSNDYAVPKNLDIGRFLVQSIPLLGDVNGEFRERCVYGTLHRWVVSGVIDTDHLRAFHLALLEDNALFAGIGEQDSDSVYLRAFCVLMLVPSLYAHREDRPFLTPVELGRTSRDISRYLREERDLRGYVSAERWWAHGIAHAADAVKQLVQCADLEQDHLLYLLDAVADVMTVEHGTFAHEEDARMAAACIELLKGNRLSSQQLETWLNRVVPTARFNGTLPGVHLRYVNARNFLRCLFFQSTEAGLPNHQHSAIESAHASLPAR